MAEKMAEKIAEKHKTGAEKPIELICIACPMGCHLSVVADDSVESGFRVSHNQCPRGEVYAIKELTAPTRILTTTVLIKNGFLKRLPVKTSGAIPKELMMAAMAEINQMEIAAPVESGQILIENLLGTGVNVVSARKMHAREAQR